MISSITKMSLDIAKCPKIHRGQKSLYQELPRAGYTAECYSICLASLSLNPNAEEKGNVFCSLNQVEDNQIFFPGCFVLDGFYLLCFHPLPCTLGVKIRILTQQEAGLYGKSQQIKREAVTIHEVSFTNLRRH